MRSMLLLVAILYLQACVKSPMKRAEEEFKAGNTWAGIEVLSEAIQQDSSYTEQIIEFGETYTKSALEKNRFWEAATVASFILDINSNWYKKNSDPRPIEHFNSSLILGEAIVAIMNEIVGLPWARVFYPSFEHRRSVAFADSDRYPRVAFGGAKGKECEIEIDHTFSYFPRARIFYVQKDYSLKKLDWSNSSDLTFKLTGVLPKYGVYVVEVEPPERSSYRNDPMGITVKGEILF